MAEVTWADGSKETAPFPQAPEGEMSIRAPSAFEQYRAGRQRMIEAPLKAVGMPAGAAESIGEFLTPQTKAEQGIEAATIAAPGVGKLAGAATRPLVRAATRYGLPAVGGAGGSLASDVRDVGHAAYEAGRGALYGLAGDLIPGAVGLARRGRQIEKADEKAIGGAVEKLVPSFGEVATKHDLNAIGVQRRGISALTNARAAMVDDVTKSLKGELLGPNAAHPILGPGQRAAGHDAIEVPALHKLAGESLMRFPEALNWLSRLSDVGWVKDQLASGLNARDARAMREAARTQVVEQLNKRAPGVGDRFDARMNELAKGHLLVSLFGEPGVIAKGKLDMNALRDTLAKSADGVETYAQRLEKLAKPEEIKPFYDALTRGSGDLVARDTPGHIGLRLHASPFGTHVSAGMPHLPTRVGTTPPIRVPSGGTPLSLFAQGLTREAPEQ